jgi:hypothetical protein
VITDPAFALDGWELNDSAPAAAGLIVKGELTALVSVPFVAVSVLEPALVMLKSANVAIPEAFVFCVVVPFRGPVPALRATAIGVPAASIGLPNESLICAVTAAIVTPAVVVAGGAIYTTAAGAPGSMMMEPDVAAVSAGLLVNWIVIVSETL